MKHSVVLEYKRCRGCTTCIKTCPTEAIRVRRGKATILHDRCIDCGRCIQVCPHKAIKSVSDSLYRLGEYAYCVAIPDPALYGQFQNLDNIDIVLNGLKAIGFHKVFESARASELLSDYARRYMRPNGDRPVPQISSACPTVLRLIRMRFPKLIGQIEPTLTPMELSAILARREAMEETGLPSERIGVFSIVPCSSKVTLSYTPERLEEPVLDGAFSIRDIYLRLLRPMRELQEVPPLCTSGVMGVGWGTCGGEGAARLDESYVAVDGISNVIRMLEELEDGRVPEASFVELCACTQGCVGGCLNVENPYIARGKLKRLMKNLPMNRSCLPPGEEAAQVLLTQRELEYTPAFLLDEDRQTAMAKQLRIQELEAHLPGLHCGSCGAPTCHAFAEDVVMGRASEEDCIFKVRERMRYVAGPSEADAYLPAPFRRGPDNPSRR